MSQLLSSYAQYLVIRGNILNYERDEKRVPVVSFDFLVEVTNKIHHSLAHLGRNKLIDLVGTNFWHPACDKVARDICKSCLYCQTYKASNMVVAPPTMKIETTYPFEMIAIDLLSWENSSNGYIGCCVAVDHYSKFAAVAPIKDKKGSTIARIFENEILPKMIRIPTKILSDNGCEFKSESFNDVCEAYNMEHLYITSGNASSNGAVERLNMTLTDLIRALIYEKPSSWDEELQRTVMIYNTTLHTKLGTSPSKYLIGKNHEVDNSLPLNADMISTWKPGHPAFSSFKLNQKESIKKNSYIRSFTQSEICQKIRWTIHRNSREFKWCNI